MNTPPELDETSSDAETPNDEAAENTDGEVGIDEVGSDEVSSAEADTDDVDAEVLETSQNAGAPEGAEDSVPVETRDTVEIDDAVDTVDAVESADAVETVDAGESADAVDIDDAVETADEDADDADDDSDGTGGPPDPDQLPIALAAKLTDPAELAAALEAILFVVDTPLPVATLAASLQQTTESIRQAVDTLRAGYDERHAGFELRDVAGGVRLYTRADHADVVEHFLQGGQRSRLTQAALETLAVIAYRQPVTRARVSAIRGVNVDGVVRTLLARGLIIEVGSDPETGGGLFRTTEMFLEKMGLDSLDQLPSLAPLLPGIEGLDSIDSIETEGL